MSDEFKPKTQEELREEVVADLKGDNEDFDESLMENAINRVTATRLKDEDFKASVHAQKSEKQKKIDELESQLKADKSITKPADKDEIKTQLKELRDEETLEELEYSDEIKEKIKSVAKYENISVKKASTNPYIQSLIEEEKRLKAVEDASIKTGNKGKGKIDLTNAKPNDFDLSTEDGRSEWEEFKKQKGLK